MISTQPGSTPLASFKIMSLEDMDPHISYMAGNDFGGWDRFFLLCVCVCVCMHACVSAWAHVRVCVSVKRLNKIMSLEDMDPHISYMAGNDFGGWDRLCVCVCVVC